MSHSSPLISMSWTRSSLVMKLSCRPPAGDHRSQPHLGDNPGLLPAMAHSWQITPCGINSIRFYLPDQANQAGGAGVFPQISRLTRPHGPSGCSFGHDHRHCYTRVMSVDVLSAQTFLNGDGQLFRHPARPITLEPMVTHLYQRGSLPAVITFDILVLMYLAAGLNPV